MSGGKHHTVQQGESVESIAFTAGHFWETVWKHPDNAALRELRRSPHVLLPGDVVFVPPLEQKEIERPTGQQHPFHRKGVPSRLKVRFLVDDKPRASAAYAFFIDGKREKDGQTDGDGLLDEPVSPLARRAEVHFTAEPPPEPAEPANFDDQGPDIVQEPRPAAKDPPAEPPPLIYTFDLRHLDPTSEISGLQGRLRHLGYAVGAPDGTLDPRSEEALRAFQTDHDLEVTGELDQATQDRLRELADG